MSQEVVMGVVAVLLIGSVVAYYFNTAPTSEDYDYMPSPEPEKFKKVSLEAMDKKFDRSAGRWCDACKIHGSHHTDKHNEFAESL